jgi:hypothetical protein
MTEPDRRRFERDLETRGEAVPAGEPLPPGATHEMEAPGGGAPRTVRRRFSVTGLPDGDPNDAGPDDAGPDDAGPDDAGPDDAGPDEESAVQAVFFDLGDTLGTPVLSGPPFHLIGFEVFEFTVPVLTDLGNRGLRLGVTANPGDEGGPAVDAVLGKAGIRDFFEPALRIYSRDVGLHKDSPDIFLLAATRAQADPHRCVYVGEDPTERGFARVAGLLTAAHPLDVQAVIGAS